MNTTEQHGCGQCNFHALCSYCINGELTPEGQELAQKQQERARAFRSRELARAPQMATTSCRT
jgi:hypothetical protein